MIDVIAYDLQALQNTLIHALPDFTLACPDTATNSAEELFLYYYEHVVQKNKDVNDIQVLIDITDTYDILLSSTNDHLLKRIVFILNEYDQIIRGFKVLLENIQSITKHYQEISVPVDTWQQVSAKDMECMHRIKTPCLVNELQTTYTNHVSVYLAKLTYIADNLPFHFWELANVKNENKLHVFFKKYLTRKLRHYFMQIPVTQYKKEQFLTLCFVLLNLSLSENAHEKKFLTHNPLDRYDVSLYKTYLRDEGRNFWLSSK